uniref:Uncharacterized protein n=1 Tax=Oryza punctata TaxID=4537 RepID=A0A0E0M789_ORYPU
MSQHQQISPQQMAAMSPQLSSGTMQQVNNNVINHVATPGPPPSPQLSSQTHGSVNSIANSPMEQLQGANKGESENGNKNQVSLSRFCLENSSI